MMSVRACASPSTFSLSKLVVGSSNASRPLVRQKVSANARRMIMEASTFCPALQRPLMREREEREAAGSTKEIRKVRGYKVVAIGA